ncbi:Flavin-containing monooxygenase 1 [Carabus blaptoides fortunei]
MKVCVIGAGAAGLVSARQATHPKYGHQCTIFEQTSDLGGTWVYTDQTGLDEFGIPIHTSMYKNLRTNLPKEAMVFPEFPIPDCEESYLTQEQILKLINDYADHFKLRPLIQFCHRVRLIEPQGSGWKVTVTDLKRGVDKVYNYDAVMICNGHYHTPSVPEIQGNERFAGEQVHSHDFRNADDYIDKRVVVIGAGPSGMDIALQISATAKEVYLSHHRKETIKTIFPNNLIMKPDVASLTEEEVIFKDGSRTSVDVVMYCTGYLYSFPFLSESCRIRVDNNHVTPLYKQLMNIHYPTMCFVGLQFHVCPFQMFDLQARFFFAYLNGEFQLPSKDEMLIELDQQMKELFEHGYSKKHAHMMGPKQEAYYNSLSSLAKIRPIPPVMTQLHNESSRKFNDDLVNFRKQVYRIVDDNTFVRIK